MRCFKFISWSRRIVLTRFQKVFEGLESSIPQNKKLRQKLRFTFSFKNQSLHRQKNKILTKNLTFFNIIFGHEKIDGIFKLVHLLLQENRFVFWSGFWAFPKIKTLQFPGKIYHFSRILAVTLDLATIFE